MLRGKDAMATIAVKDLAVAKKFYQDTLGLEQLPAEEPVLLYKSGTSQILVYESQYAGTNKATAVTWVVGKDVEGVAQTLKSKGVAFEHYDFPDTTRRGDVHIMGDLKVAWFKDPDGNIHSIISR